MNLLIQVFIVILWSRHGLAERLATQSSVAIPSNAFLYTPNLNYVDKSNSFEIQNMPAIQSQDTAGTCFGCHPAIVAQKFLCDFEPSYTNLKCNDLPIEKMISQLSMIAWADTNELKSRTFEENKNNKQIPGDPDNHTNLNLYGETSLFSSGSNALLNSRDAFSFMPESCYPFDQLVSKYGNKNSKLFEEIYYKTKELYLRNRITSNSSTNGGSTQCDECLSQLNTDFNSTFSNDSLQSALRKESYGEFLFELLFHNCKPIEPNTRPRFFSLPGKEKKIDKEKAKINIKQILKNNHPVLITDLCLEVNAKLNTCTSSHTTVISGYRKACPTNNLNSKSCKNQVKIHNCWGKDWQNLNNDGWIDEDSIFRYLNYGSSTIDDDQISWLEK